MNISDLDYQQTLSKKGIILLRGSRSDRLETKSVHSDGTEIRARGRGLATSLATGDEELVVVTGFSFASFLNGLFSSESITTSFSQVGEEP